MSNKEKITEDKDYDIRFSYYTDENFLKEAMEEEEVRRWYPPSSDSDVQIFIRNWAGFARYKCSLTACYKGEAIGMATIFLMPYVKVSHLAMVYLVVKKEFQGKGVGYSLLKNINHLAKTNFNLTSLHIEVFGNCPMISLAKELGYKELFTQKNFVELDGKMESRTILEVDLKGGS
ncbi:GNAT family N-acetyltransferase [bacterium]|nr:GNAT family N-acetyltransferase [bacterium]